MAGGAREGAGRKRSILPPELLEAIGTAPLGKPLQLARWYTNLIAALTEGIVFHGKPWTKLLETVRASAGAAGRVLPHDIVYEAQRILNADAKDLAKNTSGPTPAKREESGSGERKRASTSRRNPD